ncbi:hypothetical protein LXL04_005124 [Taraxacum kok-saghyz]
MKLGCCSNQTNEVRVLFKLHLKVTDFNNHKRQAHHPSPVPINTTFFVPNSLPFSLVFPKFLHPVANQVKLRDGDLPIHIRIRQRGSPRQTL